MEKISHPRQDPAVADFRNFLFLIWKHLNLPDPTPVQYDIAEYLQTGPRRKVIEAFRGVGKTWITSAYVLWRIYWNPSINILVVSASKQHADNFSTFTKRLLSEVDWLDWLKPSENQRDSMVAFDVGPAPAAHAPTVKSVGITGQMTGSRADLIVADDIEVPNNSLTQVMRDKMSEAVKEFDAILKPNGEVAYLGTPQTEQSLYNTLEQRGYSIRVWPARYPDQKLVTVYGHRLAPRIHKDLSAGAQPGDPTDPVRFNHTDLLEREASYGRSGFSLQFMLDTSLSDANRYPLKLSDMVVMDLDPEVGPERVVWAGSQDYQLNDPPSVGFNGDNWHRPMKLSDAFIPYKGVVMAVDPSGRGKDELGAAVVGNINAQLFLLESLGLHGGYDDKNLRKLAETAKKFKVGRIIVEENYGDGMFSKLLTPHLRDIYPCTMEEVKHSKQKELRIIDTLEPVLNQHRLIVDRGVILRDMNARPDLPEEERLRYQLFRQLTRITRDRGALIHDDRLDALAIAVAYWVGVMGADREALEEDRKARLQEAAIRDFLRAADRMGGPKKERTWLTTNRRLG